MISAAGRAAAAGLLLTLAVAESGDASGDGGALPEPPRVVVDTTPPRRAGRTIAVHEGGDLQAALERARPGDSILLEAGAIFTGSFVLPRKDGEGWIVVRTSAPDERLPPPGTRITPEYAPVLPRIVSPGPEPALRTAAGAHHYRVVGVEFTLAPGVDLNYNLILLGDFGQSSLEQVPHHLILDRVYVHGAPTANVRRGVTLNSAWTAVIDSCVSGVHEAGADSQAVGGSTGPGPFKIVNNYLEGSGENILFGGADPKIAGLVPSDIEIRRNHVTKPLAWMKGHPDYAGLEWTVKNLLELKNARRVLIDGNLFEHNWPAAQSGFAILFTVRNQDGSAPWSVIEDVTFTNNVVRRVASAINILGRDDNQPSRPTRRILIRNNLFEDVGGAPWGGRGRFLQILDGAAEVVVEQNTVFQTGDIIAAAGRPHTGFVYRNNVAPHNRYGVGGDDHFGDPMGTLRTYFPDVVFTGNVIVGGDPSRYPKCNSFPAATKKHFAPRRKDAGAREPDGGEARPCPSGGVEPGADPDRLRAAHDAAR
jgi:hypothetical protein